MNKPGPKPYTNRKRVFYRRVTDEEYDALTLFHQGGSKPMRISPESAGLIGMRQLGPNGHKEVVENQGVNVHALLEENKRLKAKIKEYEQMYGG